MSEGEYTIQALKKLHGELHARLLKSRAEGNTLRHQMKAIESVIKLLRPGENMRALVARRVYRPNPLFKKGEITRQTVAVLRDAGHPLTADEICAELLKAKGIVSPTRDHLKGLRTSVLTALNLHSGKSVVGDHGRPQRWNVIKP
jgi:hypothetical protein